MWFIYFLRIFIFISWILFKKRIDIIKEGYFGILLFYISFLIIIISLYVNVNEEIVKLIYVYILRGIVEKFVIFFKVRFYNF